jgi:hypothetical protein
MVIAFCLCPKSAAGFFFFFFFRRIRHFWPHTTYTRIYVLFGMVLDPLSGLINTSTISFFVSASYMADAEKECVAF